MAASWPLSVRITQVVDVELPWSATCVPVIRTGWPGLTGTVRWAVSSTARAGEAASSRAPAAMKR
jgi:hypothetical protein